VPNFIIQTSYQTVATKTFEICSRAVQTYSCTQSIDVFGHRKALEIGRFLCCFRRLDNELAGNDIDSGESTEKETK
jgi:hypothetical protein